jgi:hypothetical protein
MPGEAEYLAPNEENAGEITEIQPSALAIINQSEHAAMVQTANLQGNRRNLAVFSKKTMEYATHSQPVALSMFYTLPRAGKQIVGPSVRYAEIVAPCWRNNSTGTRMIGSTEDTVTAQGIFIDYEANNRNVKEIPRKITNSQGQKFNADMILTTGKAVLSIAYREAVLKGGVPMALWNPAYEAAKQTAVGSALSHAARVDAAMEYLNKLGVTEWQICNSVGVTSPKELEIDHLVTLKTLCEEIKKGARTIEEVFGSPHDKEIESLFTQLGKNETEKRLLRNSYMGRAKDLLDYLRERVNKPAGQTVAREQKTETQTENKASNPPATEQAPQAEEKKPADAQPEVQVKSGRGRPSKEAIAAREAAKRAAESQQTAQEETTAQAETESTEGENEVEVEDKQSQKPATGSFNF